MAFTLLLSKVRFCFQHINQTLRQFRLDKIAQLPIMNLHFKDSPCFVVHIPWEILAVIPQIIKYHFENPWVPVQEYMFIKLFELMLA